MLIILRPDANGGTTRLPVDLKGFADPSQPLPTLSLRGGDSVFVPRAPDFYIYGEVRSPNKYRFEPGMRVLQAIAKGGGPTEKGSTRRVEIKRKAPPLQLRARLGGTAHAAHVSALANASALKT